MSNEYCFERTLALSIPCTVETSTVLIIFAGTRLYFHRYFVFLEDTALPVEVYEPWAEG
jgi:hypothetical protein